jgi:hypothetical protein
MPSGTRGRMDTTTKEGGMKMIRELKARLRAAIKQWQRDEWERSGRVPDMYVSDYGYRLEVQFADEEHDELYTNEEEE